MLLAQLHHQAVHIRVASQPGSPIAFEMWYDAQAEGIGHLTALTLLELGSNRLRDLGPIASLTGLRELWLGRNRLTSLDGMSQ